MITTSSHHSVEEFASEYEHQVPRPSLYDSAAWLRYCERRSPGMMRYLVARDPVGRLVGVTACRTVTADNASANYDIAHMLWPQGRAESPVPRDQLYPQVFAAVSGTHCLLSVTDAADVGGPAAVRTALLEAAGALADSDGALLTFAYLQERQLAAELCAGMTQGEFGVVDATARMDAEWTDFEGYVAALPESRRRTGVRRERARFLRSGLRTRVCHGTSALTEHTARLHTAVPAKHGAATSVEGILADYDALARTLEDRVVLFLAERDGSPVAICLCLLDGETLHLRSVGLDYANTRDSFAYFNIFIYEPLVWGLRNGITRFSFGTGTYEAKQQRGCRLDPLFATVSWPPRLVKPCGGALAQRELLLCAEADLGTPAESR